MVHRFAIALVVSTFVLTIFGGLVSTTASGLACPDWPLCEGQMFPKMVNGKEFEHTHRLVALFVLAMSFSLTALVVKYRRHDRPLVLAAVGASALVVVQALLGALTVVLRLPWWVSSTHLATATAFFALTVTLAFWTRQRLAPPAVAPGRPLLKLIVPVGALVYAQVVAGAVMRHTHAGLACGFDLPLCNGALWPMDQGGAVHVHMLHRVLGVVVGLAVLWLSGALWRSPLASPALRRLAQLAAVAVVCQVALGILVVLWSRPLPTMTIHSSLGLMLWALVVSMGWVASPSAAPAAVAAPAPEAPLSGNEVAA